MPPVLCIISPDSLISYASYTSLIRILQDDEPTTLNAFKKWRTDNNCSLTAICITISGYSRSIFTLIVEHCNIHLLEYTIQQLDNPSLNTQDKDGCSVFHRLVTTVKRTTIEKVIHCVEILMNAGININLGDENTPLGSLVVWKTQIDCREIAIRSNVTAPLLLEQQLAVLSQQQNQADYLARLLISLQATCRINKALLDVTDNTPEATFYRQEHDRVIDWSKTRFLFLAAKDQGSSLSKIPYDIIQLLFNSTSQML